MAKKNYKVIFESWKSWTLQKKRTPRKLSKDEFESDLCDQMQSCLSTMKLYPDQYADIIREYDNLNSIFGGKRTKEQRLKEWEEWVFAHDKLPRAASEDKQEARVANTTRHIIDEMKKEPEKNVDLLQRYNAIHHMYLQTFSGRACILKSFREWKKYVQTNGIIPSISVMDDTERKIATNFYLALKKMRKQAEMYSKELAEYTDIANEYKDGRQNLKYKLEFKKYKQWIINNEKFPKQTSEDITERRLAGRMERIFRILKNNPDIFADELNQLDMLNSTYKKSKKRSAEQIFEEWKDWCKRNNRLPKSTKVNREESRIYFSMLTNLCHMRLNTEKYAPLLEEYNDIYELYNGSIYESYNETFELWKKWVVANDKIPKSYSENEEEAKLANKMWYIIGKLKNDSNNYANILEEYENICEKYKKRSKKQKILKLFNSWKAWCVTNGSLPKSCSKNKYEAHIYSEMARFVNYMRQDQEYYSDILIEYEEVISKYKKDKSSKASAIAVI